jgi:hypothetical protein
VSVCSTLDAQLSSGSAAASAVVVVVVVVTRVESGAKRRTLLHAQSIFIAINLLWSDLVRAANGCWRERGKK